jgi:hypothetical protein
MFADLESDVYEPYLNLISCNSFRGEIEGCPTNIPYEQILSDLISRFSEYGCDHDEIEEILA